MQGSYLYEYAVIRVLPKVEREEFINVGLILFCKRENYIKVLFHVDEKKLSAFCSELDLAQINLNLRSLEKIANGEPGGGPIAMLDLPSRFRWLTAVRSSSIQTSRPHPGLCKNLDDTSRRLFGELVL